MLQNVFLLSAEGKAAYLHTFFTFAVQYCSARRNARRIEHVASYGAKKIDCTVFEGIKIAVDIIYMLICMPMFLRVGEVECCTRNCTLSP